MKRLIFGCGYLGLRVALRWIAGGDVVYAVTRSEIRAASFRELGIKPIVADVTLRQSLESLPDVDTVLFAVSYDRRGEASRREVYVDGLENALSAMSGRVYRWISISSTSVYGQDCGEWVDEHSPCEPGVENGQIIREAEELLLSFFTAAHQMHPYSWQILRLAGIYGPGRLLRRVEALKSGEPIEGRGDAWLNLIHVDDAVRAVVACGSRDDSGITLVCDDRPVERREYYGALARLAGAPVPRFLVDVENFDAGLNKRCSNHKLRNEWKVVLEFPTYEAGLPQAFAAP